MMLPAPPHRVAAGPLAVRWLGYRLPPHRAGAAAVGEVELENAGSVAWRSQPGTGVHLSYHWLDLRGNPIVWAGAFILLPSRVEPGERISVYVTIRAPVPPGRYRLALDLVDEGRSWFADLGNERLELEVDVLERLAERTLAVRVGEGSAELREATSAALGAQEEPVAEDGEATAFLGAGCRPAPDWSRRILDAHAEGYAAVAGSVALDGGLLARRRATALNPWRPGFGRAPSFAHPLLCPSLVTELVEAAPWAEPVAGLPALDQKQLDEAWLCDGRIVVRVAARALRRAGRPPA
ncbi:MAG TPA: hypothetical protein VGQ68_00935 [Gaiellaceae bacterium]|jgi:hypothetical protein|nr:hypothetical protein [Gaiellaceae bacterium]